MHPESHWRPVYCQHSGTEVSNRKEERFKKKERKQKSTVEMNSPEGIQT